MQSPLVPPRIVRDPESINQLNSDLFRAREDDRYSDPAAVRKKAMDFLARRDYGREELIRKLANAGYESPTVVEVVGRLSEEGLQDDRRFVENFIQSRVNQGKGPMRIQADLGHRGLPGGLVDEVLDDYEVDWFELAAQVREKKFGLSAPGNFKEKARQMRFLQQRGFEQAHIQSAVSGAEFD